MVIWWFEISVRENREWISQWHSQHLAQDTQNTENYRVEKHGPHKKKKMAWVWIHVLAKGKQYLFLQISSLGLRWQLWLYIGLIIVQRHMNCFASTSYVCVGFFSLHEIKQFKFHGNISKYYQPRYIIVSDIWFVRGFYILIC